MNGVPDSNADKSGFGNSGLHAGIRHLLDAVFKAADPASNRVVEPGSQAGERTRLDRYRKQRLSLCLNVRPDTEVDVIKLLSEHSRLAFGKKENLHLYNSRIEELDAVYRSLKDEYLQAHPEQA